MIRLKINVHDDRKIVEIWLSHSEQAGAALREQLRSIYQEYNGKKYTVAVFQSGTEDLDVYKRQAVALAIFVRLKLAFSSGLE